MMDARDKRDILVGFPIFLLGCVVANYWGPEPGALIVLMSVPFPLRIRRRHREAAASKAKDES